MELGVDEAKRQQGRAKAPFSSAHLAFSVPFHGRFVKLVIATSEADIIFANPVWPFLCLFMVASRNSYDS